MALKMIEKICRLLDERGMAQGELETLAGLARNRISKWKDGQGEPTARQACRMAKVLEVDPGWLIDDERESAHGPGLSRDEISAAGSWRGSGLTLDELSEVLMKAAVEKQLRALSPGPEEPPQRRQN